MSLGPTSPIEPIAVPTAARRHIDRIRREKFGLHDDSAAATVVNPLAEDLRGSLQQLSEGLYSEDVHFIFELIQNAEDNTYPDTVAPALSFQLLEPNSTNALGTQGVLILYNNETGFTESNVDALCAVGRSTKTKQGGYIGEKGIGFKSVFQISSTPHVFSGGYAFRLPEHEPVSQLGYIVPEWVSEKLDLDFSGTVLILPLKDGVYGRIDQALRDIAAETILFLTKLRSLEITIEPAYRCKVEKDDSEAPLVRMKSSIHDARSRVQSLNTERVFWVETKSFPRPANVTAAKRDGITSRDVTVALPLSEQGAIRGSLYAYLPVRKESGLPFLVNADFLVTASREELKRNEPWNDWLLRCLVPTFISAFEKLLQRQEYRNLAYRHIPLPRIDDERLRRTAIQMIEALRLRNILITEDGSLVLPSEGRRASELLRSAFDPTPRPALLQRQPLIASTLEQDYEEQLDALNVPWLSDAEICECLQDTGWLGKRAHQWFVQLFSYLCRKRDSIAGKLGELPLLLLDDRRLSKAASRTVYLMITQEDRRFLASVPQRLQTGVLCLHQDVYSDLCRDPELILWARQKLGLQDFKRSTYCSDVAGRLTDTYLKAPADLILAATRFLALAHQAPATLPDLPLLLRDDQRTLLSDVRSGRTFQQAAMPFAVDPDTGWQHVFEDGERNHIAILSDAYLEPPEDGPGVVRFLKAIGITDAPLPARVSLRTTSATATASERLLLRSVQPHSTREPLLTNYRPPTWLRNLEADGIEPSNLAKKAEALVNWIEGTLVDSTSKPIWASGQLSWFRGIAYDREFESDMLHCLKSAAWLPTDKGLCRPEDTFINSPTIRLILGNTVPIMAGTMPRPLIELLGIREHASADVLISFLKSLSNRDERATEAVSRIYGLVANERPNETIESAFKEHPIILLSTAKGWYTSGEVVWADRSQSLPGQFGYLERAYPKLREFFVEKLGVKSDVDAESFANRWITLSAGEETNEDILESAFAQIFSALLPECRRIRGGEPKPDWWDDLAVKIRFWCHDGKFRKPDQAFAGDDPEIRKLFEHRVGFVHKPKDQSHARLEDLYRAFGVRFASEALTTRLGNNPTLSQQQKPQFITKAALAQIAAWAHSHREEYDRLKKDSLLPALLKTNEVHTISPKIIFCLGSVEVESTRAAYWEAKAQRLYLEARRCSEPAIKEEIAETLAKGLMPNRPYRELEDLIYRILGTNDEQAHLFIRKRDWTVPPEAKDLLEKRIGQQATSALQLTGTPTADTPAGKLPVAPPANSTPSANLPAAPAPNDTPRPAPLATFQDEVQHAFAKPQVQPPTPTAPSGPVVAIANPLRRRDNVTEQIHESILNEPPVSERTTNSLRQVWECRDTAVRQFLQEEYSGNCQICRDVFPKRDGHPFFVSKYIVSRTTARTVERAGNSLCLCPTCAAKFEHGEVLCDSPEQQILALKLKNEGGQNGLALRLRLCGKEVEIKYSEKHLLDFQELLRASGE